MMIGMLTRDRDGDHHLPRHPGPQRFRLSVELMRHRLDLEKIMPVPMTREAENLDVLTEALAPLVALALWR